jgi:hypothetical protein
LVISELWSVGWKSARGILQERVSAAKAMTFPPLTAAEQQLAVA